VFIIFRSLFVWRFTLFRIFKRIKCLVRLSCVKRELKGLLKYIGVKACTPHTQTVTDIAAKSNSEVRILWKTIDFKISVLEPFPGPPTTCYDKHLSLPMDINSMKEFTNRNISCRISYSTIHAGLSCFSF